MKYIHVEIDAMGFPHPERIGSLGYDMIRGNAAYQKANSSGLTISFDLPEN